MHESIFEHDPRVIYYWLIKHFGQLSVDNADFQNIIAMMEALVLDLQFNMEFLTLALIYQKGVGESVYDNQGKVNQSKTRSKQKDLEGLRDAITLTNKWKTKKLESKAKEVYELAKKYGAV